MCGATYSHGGRSFDLATVLFYRYRDPDDEVQARLCSVLLGSAGPVVAGVYLANLLLRQIDWSLRHQSEAAVARWLTTVPRLLADLRERGCRAAP